MKKFIITLDYFVKKLGGSRWEKRISDARHGSLYAWTFHA